jgi:RNA polymerase sigma-70 factor (ECF subfamily)
VSDSSTTIESEDRQMPAAALAKSGGIECYIECYWSYLRLLVDRKIDPRVRRRVGASDIVQDTLLAAHRDWDQFRGRSEPELKQWLARILKCNVLDAQKAQRRLCRDVNREVAVSQDSQEIDLADPMLTPGRLAVRGEDHASLLAALDRLTPQYRRVVALKAFDGLSFAEIAERTGKTAEAVRHIWVRAIKQLACELACDD